MTAMLTRSYAAAGPQPAIIIDGRLALSPYGLLISLRLARRARVWLVRTLWSLLDNDQFFQNRPDLIDDNGNSGEEAVMLAEWRRAWLQANLLDRFCWIGDARHESLLPEDMPDGSVERFELLSRFLDLRGAADCGESPLGECARDAACLAAVLCASDAIILTPAGPDGAAPRLCTMLADAGIDCKAPVDGQMADQASAEVLPAGLQVLAQQLALDGFRLSAVHLLAPRALVPMHADDADPDWTGDLEPDDADPWAGSSAFWHVIG
jgi:hypothetical protein